MLDLRMNETCVALADDAVARAAELCIDVQRSQAGRRSWMRVCMRLEGGARDGC